ncbi:MAG: hypothetical protein AB1716_01340 [Planctomycetota bacterium]
MIVEHTFITTLEPGECERLATGLLEACGFRRDSAAQGGLEFRRGAKSPEKAGRPDLAPQTVRVEYDRGRVVVAASLTPARKPSPEQRDLLLTVAGALEAVLAQGRAVDEAQEPWLAVHQRIAARVRRRDRQVNFLVGGIVAFLVAVIALLVYLGNR